MFNIQNITQVKDMTFNWISSTKGYVLNPVKPFMRKQIVSNEKRNLTAIVRLEYFSKNCIMFYGQTQQNKDEWFRSQIAKLWRHLSIKKRN